MQFPLEDVLVAHTKIGENGRIVIPAAIREKLGLKGGDDVVLTYEDGHLKVQSYLATIREIQENFRPLVNPESLASEELIAERRQEWRNEMAEAGLAGDGTTDRAEEIVKIA